MDRNRRLAEALGICWHEIIATDDYTQVCSCGEEFAPGQMITCINPDFTADPTKVLVEMRKREDWPRFAKSICCIPYKITDQIDIIDLNDCDWAIPMGYILDRSGKLAEMAIEWMEGRKK